MIFAEACKPTPPSSQAAPGAAKQSKMAFPAELAGRGLSSRVAASIQNDSGPPQGPTGGFAAVSACGKLAQRVPEGSPWST
jgi:hypothetical protein